VYEHRKAPLLSRPAFFARLARHAGLASIIVAAALGIGMLGYGYFEQYSWIDAFANAAMILSGMGPLTALQSNSGKLFAGFYALFSGLVFITIMAILLAPVVHRFIHKFHLDSDAKKKEK
jgi:hypothetical protein